MSLVLIVGRMFDLLAAFRLKAGTTVKKHREILRRFRHVDLSRLIYRNTAYVVEF
jgi:hypothetical protein